MSAMRGVSSNVSISKIGTLIGAGLLFYLGMPSGVGMAEPANDWAAVSSVQPAACPAAGSSALLAKLNAQIVRHPQGTSLNFSTPRLPSN